jgi:hypothetical protein
MAQGDPPDGGRVVDQQVDLVLEQGVDGLDGGKERVRPG